jgi:hypothetical protein
MHAFRLKDALKMVILWPKHVCNKEWSKYTNNGNTEIKLLYTSLKTFNSSAYVW